MWQKWNQDAHLTYKLEFRMRQKRLNLYLEVSLFLCDRIPTFLSCGIDAWEAIVEENGRCLRNGPFSRVLLHIYSAILLCSSALFLWGGIIYIYSLQNQIPIVPQLESSIPEYISCSSSSFRWQIAQRPGLVVLIRMQDQLCRKSPVRKRRGELPLWLMVLSLTVKRYVLQTSDNCGDNKIEPFSLNL